MSSGPRMTRQMTGRSVSLDREGSLAGESA
jgi:hypothetical protein